MAGTKDRMSQGDEAEGLVSRWSRLKRESGETAPSAPKPAAVPEAEASEAAGEAVEPVRVEDLPDVETLTYESDFTTFLREGVPEELQRLALRKLWRSDPVLANVDGLNDYDLDYRVLGVDTRVTEALLLQRGVKEKLLRGADDIHRRPSAVQAARAPAEQVEAASEPLEPVDAAGPVEEEASAETGDAAESPSNLEDEA